MARRIAAFVRNAILVGCVAGFFGCENSGNGPDYSGHDFGDNDQNVIVALGDSITYGYGLASSDSYPSQLSAQTGRPVINQGVPGERSSGGLDRVNGVLDRYKPGFLLILYGSNDVIHGEDPGSTVANLRGIIEAAKAHKTIPIIGTVPPVFKQHIAFASGIEDLNPQIVQMAGEEGTSVAGVYDALNDESLFQDDGLHPTAEGAGKLASAFADKL